MFVYQRVNIRITLSIWIDDHLRVGWRLPSPGNEKLITPWNRNHISIYIYIIPIEINKQLPILIASNQFLDQHALSLSLSLSLSIYLHRCVYTIYTIYIFIHMKHEIIRTNTLKRRKYVENLQEHRSHQTQRLVQPKCQIPLLLFECFASMLHLGETMHRLHRHLPPSVFLLQKDGNHHVFKVNYL